MPHVKHRFLMHGLVLEDRVRRLGFVQQRMSRLLDRRICKRLQDECVTGVGEAADLFVELGIIHRMGIGELALSKEIHHDFAPVFYPVIIYHNLASLCENPAQLKSHGIVRTDLEESEEKF